MSGFTLALPSKGALQQSTTDLFSRCSIKISGGGASRSYTGTISSIPNSSIVFARADEIPQIVKSGRAHAGITGLDLYQELTVGSSSRGIKLVFDDMGYGQAKLVIGVPESWIDVEELADIIEVAHDLLRGQSRPLLVATKFSNLTRRFFLEAGLNSFRIVDAVGAVEAAPGAGIADVVVDLVSSGSTFRSNGLKMIEGGEVLASQACLVASTNSALWDEEARRTFRHLAELLSAGLRARSIRSVRILFDQSLSEVPVPLAGLLLGPRLLALADGSVEVHGGVNVSQLHELLHQTRDLKAKTVEVNEPGLILDHEEPVVEEFLRSID